MAELAVLLALIVLNALGQSAFSRWRSQRRPKPSGRAAQPKSAPSYPLHPSPVGAAFGVDLAPEHAAHIRPAGIDW